MCSAVNGYVPRTDREERRLTEGVVSRESYEKLESDLVRDGSREKVSGVLERLREAKTGLQITSAIQT